MIIKVGNVVGGFQSGALSRLANASLPFRTALRLKEILKVAQTALQEYDDQRLITCAQFGTLNDETGNWDIDPERRVEFQTAADALLQKDVEVPGEPFTPKHLLSSQSITTNDLMILDWLVVTEVVVDSEAQNTNGAKAETAKV